MHPRVRSSVKCLFGWARLYIDASSTPEGSQAECRLPPARATFWCSIDRSGSNSYGPSCALWRHAVALVTRRRPLSCTAPWIHCVAGDRLEAVQDAGRGSPPPATGAHAARAYQPAWNAFRGRSWSRSRPIRRIQRVEPGPARSKLRELLLERRVDLVGSTDGPVRQADGGALTPCVLWSRTVDTQYPASSQHPCRVGCPCSATRASRR